MGLDITAYRQLVLAENQSADDVDELKFYENSSFPGRAEGLNLDALYKREPDKSFGFRAGSYGRYNKWRDQLSLMAHGITAAEFWKLDDQPSAFRELIDFSDCEGVIGPVVAAKLAEDFAEYQPKADAYGDDHYWREKYAEWRKAFEMAADGGAVDFH